MGVAQALPPLRDPVEAGASHATSERPPGRLPLAAWLGGAFVERLLEATLG
jgi:hypothetical protein